MSAGLFEPFDLRGLHLPNRVVLSPMTRTRATDDGVPTALMATYYAQRASGGLLVTESTAVSASGHGIQRAPGLYREDQIAGFRAVTDAVHAAGGRIYAQLWHCGRVSHPEILGGAVPVAPSAIAAEGDCFLPGGRVRFPVPRALELDEIPGVIESFSQATRNARSAGFDGVELHAANGFLHDQFLRDGSNRRSDAYGGSIQNRARLLVETLDAMIGAWSSDRVAVRLSPSTTAYGMHDQDPLATFSFVVRAIDARRPSYLSLREPPGANAPIDEVSRTFRPLTSAPLMVDGAMERVRSLLAAGVADLAGFGVPFLANPDLVERLRQNAALNRPDPATFYGDGPRGYTDYPTHARSQAE